MLNFISVSWSRVHVEDAERNPLSPLEAFLESGKLVGRVVILTEVIDSFSVPAVGVHAVESNARLKDVNKGETAKGDGFFENALEAFNISGKGTGNKACPLGYG